MDNNNYKQVSFNPKNPYDVAIMEVTETEKNDSELADFMADLEKEEAKRAKEVSEFIKQESSQNEDLQIQETEPRSMQEDKQESCILNDEAPQILKEDKSTQDAKETAKDEQTVSNDVFEEIRTIFKNYKEGTDKLERKMDRLEKKFNDEILNAENRNDTVKTIYKELNDYKSGLFEKVLKNIFSDIIDIREAMLSQIRYLKEKKAGQSIPLEEFETYADDIRTVLENYDVTVYKGQSGIENEAVRQKIVRKVETEDSSLVKKVAESLSYGYEYNSKVIYPERISIYVKKK